MNDERMLSKSDVCDILNISQTTLDRIVLDGMLPVYRVRGQCRFKRADVNVYLDACREEHHPVTLRLPKLSRLRTGRLCEELDLPPKYTPGMKVV